MPVEFLSRTARVQKGERRHRINGGRRIRHRRLATEIAANCRRTDQASSSSDGIWGGSLSTTRVYIALDADETTTTLRTINTENTSQVRQGCEMETS